MKTSRDIEFLSGDSAIKTPDGNLVEFSSSGIKVDGEGEKTSIFGFSDGSSYLRGNAATASKLKTARKIGGVDFDGSSNINLPGVNIPGTQNTTGNADTASQLGATSSGYVKVENGNELNIYTTKDGSGKNRSVRINYQGGSPGIIICRGNGGEGLGRGDVFADTFFGNLSGNADTADSATNDGEGNNIADTYAKKNGNYPDMIVGDAVTASKLRTPVSIGGVKFDGTEDIRLPGVNYPGFQDTTGNAATATTATKIKIGNDDYSLIITTDQNATGEAGVITFVLED